MEFSFLLKQTTQRTKNWMDNRVSHMRYITLRRNMKNMLLHFGKRLKIYLGKKGGLRLRWRRCGSLIVLWKKVSVLMGLGLVSFRFFLSLLLLFDPFDQFPILLYSFIVFLYLWRWSWIYLSFFFKSYLEQLLWAVKLWKITRCRTELSCLRGQP